MYDTRWSKVEDCRKMVADGWKMEYEGSHAFRLCERLKIVRKYLREWYRGHGRNSKKIIEKLQCEIRAAYQSINFASETIRLMERELKKAHREEEMYWRIKSRVQWLNEGDKNTKKFHAKAVKRRRTNRIVGLDDQQGIWRTDVKDIGTIVVDYFSGLLKSSIPCQFEDFVRCVQPRITDEDNQAMAAPILDSEIHEAVFQIPPTRAPGPDGFSGSFYQDHWEVVGADVAHTIKAFWHSGRILKKLNHTDLVLIPKVACPKNITQFRPIALCNVWYKILAKILANRLKNVLPKVISDNQSVFVAGKHIQDNILVVARNLTFPQTSTQ